MKKYFKIHSAFATEGYVSYSLMPGEWMNEDPEFEGAEHPALKACHPNDEGAEWVETDGKRTELRVSADDFPPSKPGNYVVMELTFFSDTAGRGSISPD